MAPRHIVKSGHSQSSGPLPTVSTTVTITCTTVRWVQQASTLIKRVAPRREVQAPVKSLSTQAQGESYTNQVQPLETSTLPRNEAAFSAPSSSPQLTLTTPSEPNTRLQGPSEVTAPPFPVILSDCHAPPHTSNTIAHTNHAHLNHTPMEGNTFELPDMPTPVLLLMYTLLGLGALGAVLVWLINASPPPTLKTTTTTNNNNNNTANKQTREGDKQRPRESWWTLMRGAYQNPRREKSKPSKYTALASSSPDATTASTSATPPHNASSPFPLRRLPTAAWQRHTPASPTFPPWNPPSPPQNRTSTAPSAQAEQTAKPSGVSPSPGKPFVFLRPTLKPRSSDEYAAAHRAFFSDALRTTTRSDRPGSPSESLTTPPAHRATPPSATHPASPAKPPSWVGGLVRAAERCVDSVVARLVAWTAEEEDELLLPVETVM